MHSKRGHCSVTGYEVIRKQAQFCEDRSALALMSTFLENRERACTADHWALADAASICATHTSPTRRLGVRNTPVWSQDPFPTRRPKCHLYDHIFILQFLLQE